MHKEGMIENRFYQSGTIKLLAKEDPFIEYLFLKLGYPVKESRLKKIWEKIIKGLNRIGGTLHLDFIWYLLTKKRAAYLFYIFLILLILAGGVAVPLLWKSINQKKLDHLRRNTEQTMKKSPVSFWEKKENWNRETVFPS